MNKDRRLFEDTRNQRVFEFVVSVIHDSLPLIKSTSSAISDKDLKRFPNIHNVGGLVYYRLRRAGYLHLLKDDIRSFLKRIYIYQWMKNEALWYELLKLKKRFEEEKIDHLFLKGHIFAEKLYGDISARRMADIDILIKPEDLSGLERTVKGEGYKRVTGYFPCRSFSIKYALHHIKYVKDNTVVEGHWKLYNISGILYDEERVWKDAVEVRIRGEILKGLSDKDLIGIYAISIFSDLQLYMPINIKGLIDLYTLICKLEGEMDWHSLFSGFFTPRQSRITAYIIAETLNYFDADGSHDELKKTALAVIGRKYPSLFFAQANISVPNYIKSKITALSLLEQNKLKPVLWWIVTLPSRILGYR